MRARMACVRVCVLVCFRSTRRREWMHTGRLGPHVRPVRDVFLRHALPQYFRQHRHACYVCMYTALFACAFVYRHKTIPADLLRPWNQSELQPYSCHCKFSNLSFPYVNKCSELHAIEFLTCLTCPFGMLCPPVDLKI